jgi:hypothetical protein
MWNQTIEPNRIYSPAVGTNIRHTRGKDGSPMIVRISSKPSTYHTSTSQRKSSSEYILDRKHHGQSGEADGTNRPQVRLQVAEAVGAQVKEQKLKVKKSMEKGNIDGTCIYTICN